MISSAPLFTGLAMTLVCLAWATILLPLNGLPPAWRAVPAAIITLLVMLPFAQYPGWYYVRGLFGDSSITALIFYIALLLQQNLAWQFYQERELILLRRLVLATAILLYPFSLGLTQFDSYRLGYANHWMLAVLFLMALFFWSRKFYFMAVIITAAVVAFSLQLLESRNLWDYLVDPVFTVAVILTWFRPSLSRDDTGTTPAQIRQSYI